jgi:hypothetical protein
LFFQILYVNIQGDQKVFVYLMITIQNVSHPQCHNMSLMDFVISPPGCGRSVTDFYVWDAHKVQLRCGDEVDGDIWI